MRPGALEHPDWWIHAQGMPSVVAQAPAGDWDRVAALASARVRGMSVASPASMDCLPSAAQGR